MTPDRPPSSHHWHPRRQQAQQAVAFIQQLHPQTILRSTVTDLPIKVPQIFMKKTSQNIFYEKTKLMQSWLLFHSGKTELKKGSGQQKPTRVSSLACHKWLNMAETVSVEEVYTRPQKVFHTLNPSVFNMEEATVAWPKLAEQINSNASV